MNAFYYALKYTGLLSNFLYMLLAIGIMSAAGLGLQMAEPNTPEHTYFIESLVLGSIICMIVIFGCYGMVCDLLSVNIIFTFFILLVLGVEYVQMRGYRPYRHNHRSLLELEQAWYQLDTETERIPVQQNKTENRCCDTDNEDAYKYMHLHIPASCYQALQSADRDPAALSPACLAALNKSYQYIHRRDKLFMWCIIGLEIFILMQTITLSILLFKLRRHRTQQLQQVPPGVRREPRLNHVNSRTRLLPLAQNA